jgi:hypothetical protein
VRNPIVDAGEVAPRTRQPNHVEVFNHVLTGSARTAYEAEVELPPIEWAFGRVIMTIDIHDAGGSWDEWDRLGEVCVIAPDGTRHGIVPFITSYRTPCHWEVDVTHFRPWLAGKTRLEVAAGTTFYKNRGFMMSVSLDFHHGLQDSEAFSVVPLWVGVANHGPSENRYRDFFGTRSVPIDPQAVGGRIFVTTTGHSQVGEFTPSKRTLALSADAGAQPPVEHRFDNVLWRDDCYLNPNRPQAGTWKYSRAGWAPGDVVRPWWIDITPYLRPGRTATLSYEPGAYDFPAGEERPPDGDIAAANQVVRSYLILYRKPPTRIPAPTLRIANIVADSNGAKAGLREGDYLAAYDGRPLDSIEDLRAAIEAGTASAKPTLTVIAYRGAERVSVTVGPGKLGVALAER